MYAYLPHVKGLWFWCKLMPQWVLKNLGHPVQANFLLLFCLVMVNYEQRKRFLTDIDLNFQQITVFMLMMNIYAKISNKFCV